MHHSPSDTGGDLLKFRQLFSLNQFVDLVRCPNRLQIRHHSLWCDAFESGL